MKAELDLKAKVVFNEDLEVVPFECFAVDAKGNVYLAPGNSWMCINPVGTLVFVDPRGVKVRRMPSGSRIILISEA